MKQTVIALAVLLAVLPLLGAAKRDTTFIGNFVIDEATWESEARSAVEHKKVILHETVNDMVSLIRFIAAAEPSIKIDADGTYTERSHFFGAVSGTWTLSGNTLHAIPDMTQPGITDPGFKPVPFAITLQHDILRYAEGANRPSDLPLKRVNSK